MIIGQTISHYKILEKLGGGGMGIVYKAQDLRLDRLVALKFLPPYLTLDVEAKERFIHEAKAASALQHNNICNIHDIDETPDGRMFMVMDCYEGETLKDRIGRGPLKIEDVLDIAIQITQGLQKAHEKGIVHRDIKTANIFITKDNVVKILDFGLAKLGGQTKLTKTGSTMGTAAYMSPEQARGQDVDHRTDIWSLGVVLYEMLTGKLPFRGEYEAALLYSIVHEEPMQVPEHRSDIPVDLALAVSRALQKEPKERYQNVRELIGDLKSISSPAVQLPKQEKSIVVLPFENLSSDAEQEYFSDGLTEEVITDLSNIRALRVISRSSAMTLKGKKKTIAEIVRLLDVQYVLEGSVRRAGNSLRITAQLIDAQNDAHLWAEKYAGTLDDVFEIQEKVSRAIVGALKLKLAPAEESKMIKRPIENVRAYECYLKAHTEVLKISGEAINRAIQYLQNALDIIGDNAFLFSGMAWAYWMLVNIGVKQEEDIVKAEEFARKALTLDPESTQAHAMLGWISTWSDTRQAIYHFKKALSVNADDTLALQGLAVVYVNFIGKVDAAIPLCERLVQIDPLDWPTKWIQGGIYFFMGQYELALPPWRRLYDESPENPMARMYYALVRVSLGQMNEAFSITAPVTDVIPSDVVSKMLLILRYAILRDREKAFQEMTPDFQKTVQRDASLSHHLAGILALLGEKNKALDWLQNAIDRGFINYPLLAEKDPLLANIRGEERFKKLMERVKYEWEHFEVPE